MLVMNIEWWKREGKYGLCDLDRLDACALVYVQQAQMIRRALHFLPELLCFLARLGLPFFELGFGCVLGLAEAVIVSSALKYS
jgi:hypothetical protein